MFICSFQFHFHVFDSCFALLINDVMLAGV